MTSVSRSRCTIIPLNVETYLVPVSTIFVNRSFLIYQRLEADPSLFPGGTYLPIWNSFAQRRRALSWHTVPKKRANSFIINTASELVASGLSTLSDRCSYSHWFSQLKCRIIVDYSLGMTRKRGQVPPFLKKRQKTWRF